MSEDFRPQHFGWKVDGKVATITLNRPEKKNPLTFASYGELVDTFRRLTRAPEIKVVVITGAGENFSSGGDVNHEQHQRDHEEDVSEVRGDCGDARKAEHTGDDREN